MPTSPPAGGGEPHSIAGLEARIDSLTDQIARLRELVARAYEHTPSATAELLRVRREPSYGDAYASNPPVTVRIGTFAGGDVLFERALRSVSAQSYRNWDAIVVCDGHEPDTAARIASLGDSRIRCVQRPRNGPYPENAEARWNVAGSHPFNEGFTLARGAWIAPIDQDDEWTTDHLETLVHAARQTRAEVVYGVGQVIVGRDGETYFGRWPPALGDFGFQTAIYHAGLTGFLYDANAYMVGEPADWNLARRMLEAGVRFDFIERIVSTYYVDEDVSAIDWWRERIRERGPFRGGQSPV